MQQFSLTDARMARWMTITGWVVIASAVGLFFIGSNWGAAGMLGFGGGALAIAGLRAQGRISFFDDADAPADATETVRPVAGPEAGLEQTSR